MICFLRSQDWSLKKTGRTIRRGIRALRKKPLALWSWLWHYFYLYNDNNDQQKTVFAIIREEFDELTDRKLKVMEEEAFDLLSYDDQESNLLR